MSDQKTYGGFVRNYDPRALNMHSIFRAEDDPRTLSPEMDEWKRKQIAKQIGCTCSDKTNQVCDICQGLTANDALPNNGGQTQPPKN